MARLEKDFSLSRFWFACVAVGATVLVAGCGQKKIDGPAPEAGDVEMRVLYLVDPGLPAFSEEELRLALDRASRVIKDGSGRTVRFSGVGRAGLQETFDGWMKPFGRLTFTARLDPSRPMMEDETRMAYARVMELLRTDKIRAILPLLGVDPNVPDISVILDTVARHLDDRLDRLRESSILPRRSDGRAYLRDRQSVFSWYTILGSFAEDTRPADLILTNDILFFDSILSATAPALVLGGIVPGYTRVFPGVCVVSTLAFLSDDPMIAELRGPATLEQKRNLLALAIAGEVGGKLVLMRQEELAHVSCLNAPMTPPFVRALDAVPAAPCPERHHPLDRRNLRADYLASFSRMARARGNQAGADAALLRLRELVPDHPIFFEIPAEVPDSIKAPTK